jgi:hypothetical protein
MAWTRLDSLLEAGGNLSAVDWYKGVLSFF